MTLASCQPATETAVPPIPAANDGPTSAPTLAPTLEATNQLSYSAIRLEDLEGRFNFDYPDTWTAEPEQMIGDRGSQQVLLSPGSTLETLVEDGSSVILLRYDWDPKNDLAAWVTTRKAAWDASGLVTLDESTRELEDGRAVVDFHMKTTDGTELLFSLTTIDNRYLEINAMGNLELCREILGTLKSIQ